MRGPYERSSNGTWMILEETGLPGVKTAMCEYLQPDIFISDTRQWGRNPPCGLGPTTQKFSSAIWFTTQITNETHRRAGLGMKEVVLACQSGG